MTNKNKVNWLDYLHGEVYCRWLDRETIKLDLPVLLDAKCRWAQDTDHYSGYTKGDILADILGILDRNGLYNVTELTMEEWMNLVK